MINRLNGWLHARRSFERNKNVLIKSIGVSKKVVNSRLATFEALLYNELRKHLHIAAQSAYESLLTLHKKDHKGDSNERGVKETTE